MRRSIQCFENEKRVFFNGRARKTHTHTPRMRGWEKWNWQQREKSKSTFPIIKDFSYMINTIFIFLLFWSDYVITGIEELELEKPWVHSFYTQYLWMVWNWVNHRKSFFSYFGFFIRNPQRLVGNFSVFYLPEFSFDSAECSFWTGKFFSVEIMFVFYGWRGKNQKERF